MRGPAARAEGGAHRKFLTLQRSPQRCIEDEHLLYSLRVRNYAVTTTSCLLKLQEP